MRIRVDFIGRVVSLLHGTEVVLWIPFDELKDYGMEIAGYQFNG